MHCSRHVWYDLNVLVEYHVGANLIIGDMIMVEDSCYLVVGTNTDCCFAIVVEHALVRIRKSSLRISKDESVFRTK